MLLNALGDYESEDELDTDPRGQSVVEEPLHHDDRDDLEYVDPSDMPEPLCLVNRRVLTIQEAPSMDQRENILHTRCMVKEQTLSVIIDGGSCCNLINA